MDNDKQLSPTHKFYDPPNHLLSSCCQASLIEAHNSRYNPRGIKRGAEPAAEEGGGQSGEPAVKRLCIEKSKDLSDESMMEDKPLGMIIKHFGFKTRLVPNLRGYFQSIQGDLGRWKFQACSGQERGNPLAGP